jgi:hypothetical protein
MCELWRKAQYGHDRRERASWVVVNVTDRGVFDCVFWPWSAESGKETWKGPLPDQQQGIIHTHPNAMDPKPSVCKGCDGDTAKQVRKPVYTISNEGVYKITPKGVITQEEGPDWLNGLNPKTCQCKEE